MRAVAVKIGSIGYCSENRFLRSAACAESADSIVDADLVYLSKPARSQLGACVAQCVFESAGGHQRRALLFGYLVALVLNLFNEVLFAGGIDVMDTPLGSG